MAARLQSVSFVFPTREPQQRVRWWAHRDRGGVPGAQVAGDRLVLAPRHPSAAWPVVVLDTAAVAMPTLVFEIPQPIDLTVGGMHLVAPSTAAAVAAAQGSTEQRLPLGSVVAQVAGHVVRVDHLGINLPLALVSASAWEQVSAPRVGGAAHVLLER